MGTDSGNAEEVAAEAVGDDALRERLRLFGLSDKELDAYLAVLSEGEATARTVAEAAGVTQRYVYDIAEDLEARGLVRVHDHVTPTLLRAEPPSEAIPALTDRLNAVTPALEAQYESPGPVTAEFNTVKSRPTAIKRLRALVEEATEEVFLSAPANVVPEIRDALADAHERGVFVLLLDDDSSGDGYDGIASVVRAWNADGPLNAVVDNRAAMVGDAGLFSGRHADEIAIVVRQGHLAGSVLSAFIGSFWPTAGEVHVTDPCELPRTFESFRHAVLHAHLHRLAGEELEAVVETQRDGELAGPVSAVRQGFLEPVTNDFPVENAVVLETDAGDVSVGGVGAFIEDHRAVRVTLRRA